MENKLCMTYSDNSNHFLSVKKLKERISLHSLVRNCDVTGYVSGIFLKKKDQFSIVFKMLL